ncbi:hypothetical protein [Candidatus Absconditicoccus praedator]|uniref:hypothetical protein n=1 Tax=Candidatus Absconditicoccus praedator TaxID=2735562 RepID=UPI001E329670|nr:hypothetical protein [Candidatus Absconditicoccus praedator]UFX83109.1 hypothetical protein HLG78_03170 [Candidatus Absconditicoccus praedator]
MKIISIIIIIISGVLIVGHANYNPTQQRQEEVNQTVNSFINKAGDKTTKQIENISQKISTTKQSSNLSEDKKYALKQIKKALDKKIKERKTKKEDDSSTQEEYSPSQEELLEIENAKRYVLNQLETKSTTRLKDISERFRLASIRFRNNNKFFSYAFDNIKEGINDKISSRQEGIEDKIDFFKKYGQEITSGVDNIPQKCLEHYEFVDQIAKERNFPTAFIVATWFRESNCRMENPENGDGPFQILSIDYTPGEITKNELEEKINDFIDFSKSKQRYYQTNPMLREHYGERELTVEYDNYDLRSLRLQAVLYNGLTSNNTPTKSYYANGNLNEDFEDSIRDGVITMFLKLIKWEAENM